jgi:hypothetical protein
MHADTKHINHFTLGFSRDYFEIIALFCMYVLGIPSLSMDLRGKFLKIYHLGPGQLHPNRWIILFAFDEFF